MMSIIDGIEGRFGDELANTDRQDLAELPDMITMLRSNPTHHLPDTDLAENTATLVAPDVLDRIVANQSLQNGNAANIDPRYIGSAEWAVFCVAAHTGQHDGAA